MLPASETWVQNDEDAQRWLRPGHATSQDGTPAGDCCAAVEDRQVMESAISDGQRRSATSSPDEARAVQAHGSPGAASCRAPAIEFGSSHQLKAQKLTGFHSLLVVAGGTSSTGVVAQIKVSFGCPPLR